MVINKEKALKMWDERIGKHVQSTTDFCDREIHKGLYGRTDSKKGWTIDHIQPLSNGGSNKKCNLEIMHHESNSEKGSKTTFIANERKWQVVKDKGEGCYQIVEVVSNTKQNADKDLLDEIFKNTTLLGTDFAGRNVNDETKELGFYTSNDEISITNCFYAHKDTIADQKGKTNFKTNDRHFSLRKVNNQYTFICTSNILNIGDYNNVKVFSDYKLKHSINLYKDVLTVDLTCEDKYKSKILQIFEEILKAFSYEGINYNIIVENDKYSNNEIHFYILFDTPKEVNTCKVQEFAMYFNSFHEYLLYGTANIDEMTIFHTTHAINDDEYCEFIESLKNREHIECGYDDHHSSIYVTEEVKNYLVNCDYENASFTEQGCCSLYERNYQFTKLHDLLKK